MTEDKPDKPADKPLPDALSSLSKTDEQIANELKQRFAEAIGPALAVMDEANQLGFTLGWQCVAPTAPDGRNRVCNLVAIRTKVF